jgi:YHS domain-containing protein
MMKNILFIFFIFLFTLLSCSKKQETMDKPAVTESEYNLSMLNSPIDPACGMQLSDDAIQDTIHYHDMVYGFDSHSCKVLFLKDPEGCLQKYPEHENMMQMH